MKPRERTMQIGENIKTIRKDRGMTQTHLAALVGASQRQVSCWEKGDYKPSLEMMINLSKALFCTIDELVYGLETKSEKEHKEVKP